MQMLGNLKFRFYHQSSRGSLWSKTMRVAPAPHQLLIAFSEQKEQNVTNNIKHVFPSAEWKERKAERAKEKLTQNFVISLFPFFRITKAFRFWFY